MLRAFITSIMRPEDGSVEDFAAYLVDRLLREKRWGRRRNYAHFLSSIKYRPKKVPASDEKEPVPGEGDAVDEGVESDPAELPAMSSSSSRATRFTVVRDRVLEGKDMQRVIGKFL